MKNTNSECISCRKPNAVHECQICHEPICKKCTQLLAEGSFAFLKAVPEELTHHYYCGVCYDEQVAPALESYQETMELAKGVFIFFTTQKKEIPLIKKSKESYTIVDCPDRNETIMRMAFFAVQDGYNAVMETEVTATKVRDGSYQKSIWRGKGIPALVDGEKLDRLDMMNKFWSG